jgi:hypothetical protein
MKFRELIRDIVIESFDGPQERDVIAKYLGNTFNVQDSTAENTTGREKDLWGDGQVFRERIENAGDILRELSSRGYRPDYTYIMEKVQKLRRWLREYFTEIPKDISTLEEFNKTYLRWSNAVDSREFVVKFYPKLLKRIIKEYENIPVYCKETKLAKDLVLNLLHGNRTELINNLNEIERLCEKLKEKRFIRFTPL